MDQEFVKPIGDFMILFSLYSSFYGFLLVYCSTYLEINPRAHHQGLEKSI